MQAKRDRRVTSNTATTSASLPVPHSGAASDAGGEVNRKAASGGLARARELPAPTRTPREELVPKSDKTRRGRDADSDESDSSLGGRQRKRGRVDSPATSDDDESYDPTKRRAAGNQRQKQGRAGEGGDRATVERRSHRTPKRARSDSEASEDEWVMGGREKSARKQARSAAKKPAEASLQDAT